eukprot:SAG22_NODE_1005_length_6077_cov_3.132653_2_plen_179_part_00
MADLIVKIDAPASDVGESAVAQHIPSVDPRRALLSARVEGAAVSALVDTAVEGVAFEEALAPVAGLGVALAPRPVFIPAPEHAIVRAVVDGVVRVRVPDALPEDPRDLVEQNHTERHCLRSKDSGSTTERYSCSALQLTYVRFHSEKLAISVLVTNMLPASRVRGTPPATRTPLQPTE